MKKLITNLRAFFNNLRGFFFSIRIIYLSSNNRLASIWGFASWRFAKKYADKRHEIDGKTYYVLPSGAEQLIIFNSLEMKDLRRRGFIRKGANIDIHALLHQAYYVASSTQRVVNVDVKTMGR